MADLSEQNPLFKILILKYGSIQFLLVKTDQGSNPDRMLNLIYVKMPPMPIREKHSKVFTSETNFACLDFGMFFFSSESF